MIRSLITLIVALWLVTGCQAAPEEEIQPPVAPSPARDFLAYCAEVMPEVRAFTHSMNEIERTRDEGYFDDMNTTARQGLQGVNPAEGEWLLELGLAARGFHTLTSVSVAEDYIADRVNQIVAATKRATLRCSEESA